MKSPKPVIARVSNHLFKEVQGIVDQLLVRVKLVVQLMFWKGQIVGHENDQRGQIWAGYIPDSVLVNLAGKILVPLRRHSLGERGIRLVDETEQSHTRS